MPKNYPAFVIDRCRQQIDGTAYDFVVCTDKAVGFVARAYWVRRAGAETVNAYISGFSSEEAEIRFCVTNFERVSVVLEIVEFLQAPALGPQERGRIRSLLKKAARKYMVYVSKNESPVLQERVSIGNQIKAVADIVETVESQRDNIVAHMGEEAAGLYIDNLRAAVRSLEALQTLQKI